MNGFSGRIYGSGSALGLGQTWVLFGKGDTP